MKEQINNLQTLIDVATNKGLFQNANAVIEMQKSLNDIISALGEKSKLTKAD